MFHILGWLTVVSQLVLTGCLVPCLINAGRERRSWMQPMPVPKVSAVPLVLSSGSDYVGVV